MMVGNYCDAELRLGLGPCCSPSNSDSDSSKSSRIEGASPHGKQHHQIQKQQETRHHQHHHQQQKQPITIFYNGQICVWDVTEIQARFIISMAKREMEEWKGQQNQEQERPPPKEVMPSSLTSPPQTPLPSVPARVLPPPQIINPAARLPTLPQIINPGLLRKRSLQRFLQKRDARINAAAPYNHV